jgi:hypothetical protein
MTTSTTNMDHIARDPLMLLGFALESGDRALADALIRAFARSRSLSLRAMRELAGLNCLSDRSTLAARTFSALVMLLGLDAEG